MGLNIISNYAAETAHRHLQRNEALAAKTMARLASGSRTTFASDDPASLAVGTRLRADVQAMTTATTNASHAAAVLQVAEGAAGVTTDITVRLKSLAIQAASDQLSATERQMIDVEYQQLLQELDRTAFSASFNGKRVLGFSGDVLHAAGVRADTEYMWAKTAGGVERVDTTKAPAGSLFSSSFDATTNSMTLVNLATGDSQTRILSFNPIPRGRTEKVDFVSLGVTVEINADFAKSTRDIASNVQITQGKSQIGMNARVADASSGFRQLTLADRDAATVGSSLRSYNWLDTLKVSGLRARALQDFSGMPAPFQEIRFSTSFDNSLSAALYDDSNGSPSGGADSFNVDPLNYQLGRDDLAVAGDRACVTAGTATQLKATNGGGFSAYTAVTLTIGSTTGQALSLASAATSTEDFVAKFNAAVAQAGGNFTGLAAALVSTGEIYITDAKGRTLDWTGQAGAAAPTDTALTPAVAQLEATTNQPNFAGLTSVTFTIGSTGGQTLSLSSAAADTDDFVSKFNAAVTAAGGNYSGLTATKSSNTRVVIADSKGRTLTWTGEAGGAHTITKTSVAAVTTRKTLDTALPRRIETITGFSMTLAGQSFTGSLSVTSADTAATLAAKLQTALQGLATAGNVSPANLTVENRGGILVVSDSLGRAVSALSLTGSNAQMYTRVEIRDTNGQFRSQGPASATSGAHKSLAAGDTVVVTIHNGQTGAAAKEYVELSFRIDNTDGLAELNLASGGAATPVAMLFLNSHKMFASAGQELDGTNFSFQVGHAPQAQDVLSFTLPAMSSRGLGLTHTHTATRDAARNAIGRIDPAINRVSEIRAEIGALQNRFEFTIQNLGTMKENTESGRSALMDLDVASEMTRHVTQQVLVQAGVAMLAQANGVPSQLLKLFQ